MSAPDADSNIQRLVADVGPDRAFAALTAACRIARTGATIDDVDLELLAAALGRTTDDVGDVTRWVQAITTGGPETRVRLCRSVSCSARGAVPLHGAIRRLITDLDSDVDVEDVYCLDQCDRGPAMAVNGEIYVGGEDRVIRDERPWRDGTEADGLV